MLPNRLNSDPNRIGIVALRVVVAVMLVVHGVARVALGIVDDFGVFLAGAGFPVGAGLAWSITLFEIGGGLLLAIGRFVRVLSLVFAAELVCGIVLVHAREGWFVVGAGRNGMEYSVLLIAALGVIAYASGPPKATSVSDESA